MLSDESVIEGGHLTPEERIALQAEEIKQLWQENEQLRAQVARMREVMEQAREALNWIYKEDLALEDICETPLIVEKALAEIEKAIGGGQ